MSQVCYQISLIFFKKFLQVLRRMQFFLLFLVTLDTPVDPCRTDCLNFQIFKFTEILYVAKYIPRNI